MPEAPQGSPDGKEAAAALDRAALLLKVAARAYYAGSAKAAALALQDALEIISTYVNR